MGHKENIKNIAACKLDGKLYNLNEKIYVDGKLEEVYFNNDIGMKIYINTLKLIFIKSALELFPNSKITIQHSFSKSIYGEIRKENQLSIDELKKIKERMISLIQADIPIKIHSVEKSEAISCLLYTSPSPRDRQKSRMPSSA
eukprot:TRINITY_DN5828_c0_g1_i1.p1 TRINITY_DN5828_c0_g1~~TRINITY_DN5828_c0_g1_i1.p1  ORF type:complete len:143 (+),score=27.82 TRINITY_DN5828_c0_g1_i1:34-462(+)